MAEDCGREDYFKGGWVGAFVEGGCTGYEDAECLGIMALWVGLNREGT